MEAKTLPDSVPSPGPATQAADELASFYIQATESIEERWPRTLKQGDTFALFDQLGDVTDPGLTPGGVAHASALPLRQPPKVTLDPGGIELAAGQAHV